MCASISCMRLLYSIFLTVVVSLFAEGWERPSVSGTCPLSCRHSVPCVPCLALPTATSMFFETHRTPRPARQVPSVPSPGVAPSAMSPAVGGRSLCSWGQQACLPIRNLTQTLLRAGVRAPGVQFWQLMGTVFPLVVRPFSPEVLVLRDRDHTAILGWRL